MAPAIIHISLLVGLGTLGSVILGQSKMQDTPTPPPAAPLRLPKAPGPDQALPYAPHQASTFLKWEDDSCPTPFRVLGKDKENRRAKEYRTAPAADYSRATPSS